MYRMRGIGSKGIISDVPPAELDPNMFTDGNNVRFAANVISKIGGWSPIFMEAARKEIRHYTAIKRTFKDIYYLAGQHGIYAIDASSTSAATRHNITPLDSAGVNYPAYDQSILPGNATGKIKNYNVDPVANPWETLSDKWSATIINNLVVFNTRFYPPIGQHVMDSTADPLVELPGWGKPLSADWNLPADGSEPTPKPSAKDFGWRANRICTYKSYLVALGMHEKLQATDNVTKYFPNRVRWSDVAYEGALPSNWLQDSAVHDGGFVDLLDATSELMNGVPLKDSFMIYTNSETYIVDYVGGTDIFHNRKLFSDAGVLTPESVCEFEGKHFVVSKDDIFVHDGSTRQSVVEGRVKERIFNEINSINYRACRVHYNASDKEIMILYPTNGDPEGNIQNARVWFCDRAAVWNTQYDTWTFMDLPRVWDLTFGETLPSESTPWSSFLGTEGQQPPDPDDDQHDIWSEDKFEDTLWEVSFAGIGTEHVYALSQDNVMYVLDFGAYQSTVTYDSSVPVKGYRVDKIPYQWYVKKEFIDMDDAEVETIRNKVVRTIYPQSSNQGTCMFEIGGTSYENSVAKMDSLKQYDSSKAAKICFLSNRRYHYLIISGDGQADIKLSGLDVDYYVEGTR